jgi:hypothetical protein
MGPDLFGSAWQWMTVAAAGLCGMLALPIAFAQAFLTRPNPPTRMTPPDRALWRRYAQGALTQRECERLMDHLSAE